MDAAYSSIVFQEPVGTLKGSISLRVKTDVTLTTLPAQPIAAGLTERVHAKIRRLQQLGVIQPVIKPSDWLSQIAMLQQPDILPRDRPLQQTF